MSASVYRLYDADDQLLYVGCSQNVKTRLRHHRRRGIAFTRHAEVAYATRREALDAEASAIRSERPPWNKYVPPSPTPAPGVVDGSCPSGRVIKAVRTELGLSLPALARAASVDPVDLVRVESGQGTPTSRWLQQVANALGQLLHERGVA